MELQHNIKTLCKAAGLSFNDLAARLNITRQTLFRQGKGAAQLQTIERIAAALEVPPFILLHPQPLEALQAWNNINDQQQQPAQPEPETHPDPARLIITDPDTGRRWIIQEDNQPTADLLQGPGQDPQSQTQQPKRKRGRPKKQPETEQTTLF